MSAWDIVRNCIRPIVPRADMDLSSIAYVNLLKWRPEGELTMSKFRRSWQAHAKEQFRLLRPAFVVAIGKGTADVFGGVAGPLDISGMKLEFLERGRSDRQRPPSNTTLSMPKIAQEIRQCRGFQG